MGGNPLTPYEKNAIYLVIYHRVCSVRGVGGLKVEGIRNEQQNLHEHQGVAGICLPSASYVKGFKWDITLYLFAVFCLAPFQKRPCVPTGPPSKLPLQESRYSHRALISQEHVICTEGAIELVYGDGWAPGCMQSCELSLVGGGVPKLELPFLGVPATRTIISGLELPPMETTI